MRKVYLHGHLGRSYGREFELNVATAGEAIRALSANFKGFAQSLRVGYYEVVRGKKSTGLALDVEDINELQLGRGELHIIPVAEGAKRGGVLKAILGAVLIGAAVFFSGGALGAAVPGMMGAVTWGNVAMIGLGLAIAGASQLLTPQEKTEEKKEGSYTLSGAVNVYEQGNPLPLIYGTVITGGQVISAGIDIEQRGTNI